MNLNNLLETILNEIKVCAEKIPMTKTLSKENWIGEFGDELIVETPLGLVKIGQNQFKKTISMKRDNFWFLMKPTLERPSFIIKETNANNYIKVFKDEKKPRWFMVVSVYIKNAGPISISSYRIDELRAIKKVKENPVIYVAPENQGAMQKLHDWMTNGSI